MVIAPDHVNVVVEKKEAVCVVKVPRGTPIGGVGAETIVVAVVEVATSRKDRKTCSVI